jgi:hypothetical protein
MIDHACGNDETRDELIRGFWRVGEASHWIRASACALDLASQREVEDSGILDLRAEVGPEDVGTEALVEVAVVEETVDGNAVMLGDGGLDELLTTRLVQEGLNGQGLSNGVLPLVDVVACCVFVFRSTSTVSLKAERRERERENGRARCINQSGGEAGWKVRVYHACASSPGCQCRTNSNVGQVSKLNRVNPRQRDCRRWTEKGLLIFLMWAPRSWLGTRAPMLHINFSHTLHASLLHEGDLGVVTLATSIGEDDETLPASLQGQKTGWKVRAERGPNEESLFLASYLDHLLDDSALNMTINTSDVGEDIKAELVTVEVVVDDLVEEFRGVHYSSVQTGVSTSICGPLVHGLHNQQYS